MPAPVVDQVLELIGQTPVLALRRMTERNDARVWAKCEHLNPGGSVKDRICLSMIEQAEESGHLLPGAPVVEPTSGNTGIGLAIVCGVKGHPLVLTMPESMSLERRQLLEAYGATLVLTPAEEAMRGAIAAAETVKRDRDAFVPQQFENPANPHAHRTSTARELLEAFEGDSIDAFVAAVGTGGTLSGVGRRLREAYPHVRIVAVEPESSRVLEGKPPRPSKIQGINAGFIPKNFDSSVVDEIRAVSDRVAYDTKQRLAREEGLLVGISAGANVAVALELARELGPGKNVVTVLCDTGERYFSLDTYFVDEATHR